MSQNCPTVSNIRVLAYGTDFITLDWDASSSNWELRIDLAGGGFATVTPQTVNSKPITLTGLNINTGYDIQVRSICGTQTSIWSSTYSARTSCSVITAPFTGTFDGPAWDRGLSDNAPGTINLCWRRETLSGGSIWKVGPPLNHSSTGAANDKSGTGKYMQIMHLNSVPAKDSNIFESPLIDLGSLTNPELQFWTHFHGRHIGTLELQVSLDYGLTYQSLFSLSGSQQATSQRAWDEQIVNLSDFANDTIRLRFLEWNVNTGQFNNMCIDEISVRNGPSCPRANNFQILNLETTEIQLGWHSTGNNWQLEYGAPNFHIGNGTRINANNNPFNITGLTPNTAYDVYLRDSCGPGNSSVWVGPIAFRTPCLLITAPYFENFDSTEWAPPYQISHCWDRIPDGLLSTRPWNVRQGNTPANFSGPSQDAGGSGQYVFMASSLNPPSTSELISPEIILPDTAYSSQLNFAYHMFGVHIDSLEIAIKTRQSPSYTSLLTIIGQQQNSSTAPWATDSISLNNFHGDTVRLVFKGSANSTQGNIALDNVQVKVAFPCDTPSNLTLSNATSTTLEVNWQSNNSSSTNNIRYYPESAGPGSAQQVNGISAPYTLTGLAANTLYRVEVLDSCNSVAPAASISDTARTLPCDTNIQAGFSLVRNFFEVSFTSTASGADSIFWDFGNGQSSNLQNPVYTYPSVGSFTIRQMVYNDCGNGDTLAQNLLICDTLRANFSFNPQSDTVSFSADPGNNAIGYHWNLDDSLNANGSNTTVVYPTGGIKTVVLTAWNHCGDTVQNTQTITVCGTPIARWRFEVLPPVNNGMRVLFDGRQSQNAVTYAWDFGDGNTATGSNPIHIYSTPGFTYEVTLSVTNHCNQTAESKVQLNQVSLEDWRVAAEWKVFPNPARRRVNLEWNAQAVKARSLHAYNSTGQRLHSVALDPHSGLYQLSLESFAPGLYWLELELETGFLRQALVVE